MKRKLTFESLKKIIKRDLVKEDLEDDQIKSRIQDNGLKKIDMAYTPDDNDDYDPDFDPDEKFRDDDLSLNVVDKLEWTNPKTIDGVVDYMKGLYEYFISRGDRKREAKNGIGAKLWKVGPYISDPFAMDEIDAWLDGSIKDQYSSLEECKIDCKRKFDEIKKSIQ